MEIRVIEVMSTKLISVEPETNVLDAVKKMIKLGIGNVLVIKNDKLLGILTEKDILTKIAALNKSPEGFIVKNIMSKKVITGRKSMTVQEVARLMIKESVHRVPIVERGKVVGIITSTDILRFQPALIDVLIEKFKYDTPHFTQEEHVKGFLS